MKRQEPEQSENDSGFGLSDPVMDAALSWFALLQGYPDDEDIKIKFEQWRQQDLKNAIAFSEVAGVWKLSELDAIAADVGKTLGSHDVPEMRRISFPIRTRRKKWTNTIMAVAAGLMIAICIQRYPLIMLNWSSDYQTAVGTREDITLPDGSLMTLNTASAVALNFEDGRRTVTLLQGEAYFDVVHDASRPFKVISWFSEVEVKGTAFSVRSDVSMDTVVLERGVVDVTPASVKGNTAELHPGESITATQAGLSAITAADPEMALSWRDGRLIFDNQPFGQVLREIGRYYDHSIVVTGDRIGKARVTGNYRLDNPERTIRSLAATIGGKVTRVPGGILILR